MSLTPTVNAKGTRILTPSEGKQIALASDINTVYEYQVYLGVNESVDRYIEIDKPEQVVEEIDNEE